MATRTESEGKCTACGAVVSKRQMLRHLARCAYPEARVVEGVVQIRVDVPSTPFWLDLDIRSAATMRHLDEFLRDIWLECCGHLSSFSVGPVRYVLPMVAAEFGFEPGERSMTARVSAALSSVGTPFRYEYDYGYTTELRLKVIALRDAPRRRDAVRLLARNEAPAWICECGAPASSVCSYCTLESDDAFVCDVHAQAHSCEEEAMLPIVNSPRMGVCAYGA
jgi:hypothetical protein